MHSLKTPAFVPPILFLLTFFVPAFLICEKSLSSVSVIPKPEKIIINNGSFKLSEKTVIITTATSAPVAEYLSDFLSTATGFKLSVSTQTAGISDSEFSAGSIIFKESAKDKNLGAEGYSLKVDKSKITISAESPAGFFYGVQTLRQLLPVEIESKTPVPSAEWSIPCVSIEDRPRFSWRGLMLDTSRHFMPKEFILKNIDLMAMFKLNRLHLHLTDDQGWRLEIKKYPELTKIGAWRGRSRSEDLFYGPTGKPHGGFYTQEDMKEIIKYAAERFITIVPEIEMPGHSMAALASVPGLSCTSNKFKVMTHWGVNKEVYCAGNEKVFEFLQNVLTEVATLFPGEYIHIGGDEVPKDRWKTCPKCQARISAEGLKDEAELQSYFIKRMEKFINSKGKKLIGWDEILEGGLPPRATVMSWRGMDGGVTAAIQGHDVVMSPTSNCYFDYAQAPSGEPNAIPGTLLPLCKVYSFEPVPPALTPDQAKHILGTQANLWTEHVEDTSQAEFMLYPRAAALAEVAWSAVDLKNFSNFLERLKYVDERLELTGVNYRHPKPDEEILCR